MKDLKKPTILYYHWQLTKTTNLEVMIIAYTIKSISRFSKLIYLHYNQLNTLCLCLFSKSVWKPRSFRIPRF